MACMTMVLGLISDSPEEIRDKGIVQSRLLHDDLALRSLIRFLVLVPEADDVDFILDLFRSIKEKANR